MLAFCIPVSCGQRTAGNSALQLYTLSVLVVMATIERAPTSLTGKERGKCWSLVTWYSFVIDVEMNNYSLCIMAKKEGLFSFSFHKIIKPVSELINTWMNNYINRYIDL